MRGCFVFVAIRTPTQPPTQPFTVQAIYSPGMVCPEEMGSQEPNLTRAGRARSAGCQQYPNWDKVVQGPRGGVKNNEIGLELTHVLEGLKKGAWGRHGWGSRKIRGSLRPRAINVVLDPNRG